MKSDTFFIVLSVTAFIPLLSLIVRVISEAWSWTSPGSFLCGFALFSSGL